MTDRTIASSTDLDALDFGGAEGLVPVIAQDVSTGEVRMLAYANRAALEATLETGELHFWSRARSRLWRKGETSGNTLTVSSLHSDCDGDTILALVVPAGPTCHTGERTCFGEDAAPPTDGLSRLDHTLARRAAERPAGSYTVRLLDDDNLRLKKLGEESAELVAALASGDATRAVEEAADLLYHVLVALRAQGTGTGDLLAELEARAG